MEEIKFVPGEKEFDSFDDTIELTEEDVKKLNELEDTIEIKVDDKHE